LRFSGHLDRAGLETHRREEEGAVLWQDNMLRQTNHLLASLTVT